MTDAGGLLEQTYTCPYCWEINTTFLDLSALESATGEQELIEDCRVCCHPVALRFGPATDGGIWLEAEAAQ